MFEQFRHKPGKAELVRLARLLFAVGVDSGIGFGGDAGDVAKRRDNSDSAMVLGVASLGSKINTLTASACKIKAGAALGLVDSSVKAISVASALLFALSSVAAGDESCSARMLVAA